jgi:hypothetical protein
VSSDYSPLIADPARPLWPHRSGVAHCFRIGVEQLELIFVQEQAEDDLHLSVGKVHPETLMSSTAETNQRVGVPPIFLTAWCKAQRVVGVGVFEQLRQAV